MHKAVCDECGKDCEVPFRPSGDKPIFCSDCFERKGGGGLKRSKKDDTNKQLLEQVGSLNAKLDRILKVIESGVEKKPVSKKTEAKKVVKSAKLPFDK
jgi:CxxC-x17-CxxC domain-containing protein